MLLLLLLLMNTIEDKRQDANASVGKTVLLNIMGFLWRWVLQGEFSVIGTVGFVPHPTR